MRTVTEEGLADLAREAFEGAGMKQTALARMLGVSQSSVWQALHEKGSNLSRLRIRIIETLTKRRVSGPVYLVEDERP